ncbi:hypothetical protein TRVA0_002S03158 [Trichomonascus vanleenenianus]|uniref:putative tyrosine protein phosphatase MIH1 n=1 Tax=Trichomonascus vanleenenianus TaxID=2268995 RepID=UPI003ECA69A2
MSEGVIEHASKAALTFFDPSPLTNKSCSNGMDVDSSPSFLPEDQLSAKSKRLKKKNCLFPVPNLQTKKDMVSPTASLAADLSQNFYIASTPTVPTPRRALFASHSFTTPSTSSNALSALSTPNSVAHNDDDDGNCMSDTDTDESPLPLKTCISLCAAKSICKPKRHQTSLSSMASFMLETKPDLSPSQDRRSIFRRTQSMFQHPEDVVMENAVHTPKINITAPSCASTPPKDASDRCPLGINSFAVKEDAFRRIGRDTLCEILDGVCSDRYECVELIDCRFEYEYKGGHIDGAVNINTKDRLEEYLLSNVRNGKTLVVFHCEYSAHRGPRMAQHLRNCDRQLNMARYPELYYPDIVILQGGYSHFFEKFYDRCVPQRYVEMNDSSHRRTCERELHKFRRTMKYSSRPSTYTTFTTLTNCISNACLSPINFRFPKKASSLSSSPESTPTNTDRNTIIGQKLFA